MKFKDEVFLVALGDVELNLLKRLSSELMEILPLIEFKVSAERFNIPVEAFNARRKQYNSDVIMMCYAKSVKRRTLLVTHVDLYASTLNFIFGQAESPGLLAIISLARLDTHFYGDSFNERLFMDRTVKEAVHEICHTYGLRHCPNPRCVMHFSNSILDTDFKSKLPCASCMRKLTAILE
ncbi:archaemetzincin family Zn-dependent metalloprotease [Candidatus Bathyarchaeota archaeon]|nr:archaemetzincin family Zn-dependent metalloprotease [Candidatus Bathyarchaeota archaeon]MBS7618063.1 archaemetzincin family Zn-dependent metalloprotease [Candidatus Bathyarchaeota archaeon]